MFGYGISWVARGYGRLLASVSEFGIPECPNDVENYGNKRRNAHFQLNRIKLNIIKLSISTLEHRDEYMAPCSSRPNTPQKPR
jgi:hypothetical protein